MQLRKSQGFKPTPAMQLYAFQRGKMGEVTSDAEIARKIGVSAETVCRWKQINGYLDWLESQVAMHRAPILELLELIATEQARDYRFWEALALKHGYISKAPEKKDENGEKSGLTIVHGGDAS